jgi:ribosomal protein S18 acetylase RimI-like enzyme
MVVSMHIVLRKAKETDMALVKKLTAETGWKGIPESQRKLLDREKWNRHMIMVFENDLKRENGEIFIAEDERRRFIGYLFVGGISDMMTGLNYGFIYDIFVEEKSRGKGIGKLLLEKAEDYCRKKGYSRIALMVSTENDSAIRLYSRIGFKPEQMHMAKELSQKVHS